MVGTGDVDDWMGIDRGAGQVKFLPVITYDYQVWDKKILEKYEMHEMSVCI